MVARTRLSVTLYVQYIACLVVFIVQKKAKEEFIFKTCATIMENFRMRTLMIILIIKECEDHI